jgi:hypothetical protein
VVQDLVERDLFQGAMKGAVSWLRLDGSVAPTARFDVVRQFNRDPTVEVRVCVRPEVLGCYARSQVTTSLCRLERSERPQRLLVWGERGEQAEFLNCCHTQPPSTPSLSNRLAMAVAVALPVTVDTLSWSQVAV